MSFFFFFNHGLVNRKHTHQSSTFIPYKANYILVDGDILTINLSSLNKGDRFQIRILTSIYFIDNVTHK